MPCHLNFKPCDEGYTHINIYSGSTINLGRMLSHFSPHGLTHPEYGNFACMEGFYHYVSKGLRHEFLRDMDGLSAKRAAQRLTTTDIPDFKLIIDEGNRFKVMQNDDVRIELVSEYTHLPFIHAYRHNGERYYYPGGYPIAEVFTAIRSEIMNQLVISPRKQ